MPKYTGAPKPCGQPQGPRAGGQTGLHDASTFLFIQKRAMDPLATLSLPAMSEPAQVELLPDLATPSVVSWTSHREEEAVHARDVFCTRSAVPEPLLETSSLYVIPDLYPCAPGHILIIPKEHYRCWADTPASLMDERERAAELVTRFIRDCYRLNTLQWENGIAGQEVPHAHRHLWPTRLEQLPMDHKDSSTELIRKPLDIQSFYARRGPYFDVRLGATQLGLGPSSRSLPRLRISVHVTRERPKKGDTQKLTRRWSSWQRQNRSLIHSILPEAIPALTLQ